MLLGKRPTASLNFAPISAFEPFSLVGSEAMHAAKTVLYPFIKKRRRRDEPAAVSSGFLSEGEGETTVF